MGVDLKVDRSLADDIAADVWAVNNRTIAVPAGLRDQGADVELKDVEPVRFEVRLTGWPQVNTMLFRRLPRTVLMSLAIAVALLLAVLSSGLRSLLRGAAATASAAWTMLTTLALAALLGVALDNITLVIAMIALALGAACAVFPALRPARPAAGPVLAQMAAVGLSFAVLGFSDMAAQALLGLFTAMAAVLSALGASLVLPAMFDGNHRTRTTAPNDSGP
jgi:predicted RND superfamily exporter protein